MCFLRNEPNLAAAFFGRQPFVFLGLMGGGISQTGLGFVFGV